MPRDLFGDVIDPSIKVGTRKWYSVPLSFIAHTSVIGALIVAPLVATGALPMPSTGPMIVHLATPPLPQPPPAPRQAHRPPPRVPDLRAAPISAPESIVPESTFDDTFETLESPDIGVVGGSEVEIPAVVAPPVVAPRPPEERVRVGGAVRAPERLSYVAPQYPAIALAARVNGLVIIEAVIDTRGQVQDARVLRSDSPLLNDAALGAVRQWVYSPTLLNGVPVSVIMTVTVQFHMR